MPRRTAPLRASGLRGINFVSTPSFSKMQDEIPCQICSDRSLTAPFVIPGAAAPTAMLVEEPPTKAEKLLISTKGEPISFEYKSMDERPIVIRSKRQTFYVPGSRTKVGLDMQSSRCKAPL